MYNQLAVILFACVAAVFCNDLQLGSNYGRIIFDEKIEASPAIWKQVQKITINTTKDEVISAVVVTDNRPEKDGVAKVVEGGEGQQNVTVELQSPTVFRGFDFHVVVYGIQEDVRVQYPGVISNDTEVNSSAQPEDRESAVVNPKDIKPTIPTNADEKPVEKPSPPVATGDQTRINRDTQDEQTVDPIVQYINHDLTIKGQEVTTLSTKKNGQEVSTQKVNAPEVTTDSAHKVTSTNVKTTEEQSFQTKNKAQTTIPHLPIEVSQENDVKTQEPTAADVTTQTMSEYIPEEPIQQNFDSISKELGQKVVFGIRNN